MLFLSVSRVKIPNLLIEKWTIMYGILSNIFFCLLQSLKFIASAVFLISHCVSGPCVRFALLASIKIKIFATLLASIASTASPISHYTFFTVPKMTQYRHNGRKAKYCIVGATFRLVSGLAKIPALF